MDTAVPLPIPAARSKSAQDENFPVASWFVAARHRPLIAAYYAFARQADDIADDPALEPGQKIKILNELEASLMNGAVGIGPSLRVQMADRGLPLSLATPLLTAFRRDAINEPVVALEDLMDYCHCSAAPVGRFMLAAHGEKLGFDGSDSLCAALQILNHVQDAQEDWRALKRCYLPMEWLVAEGIRAESLMAPVMSPPVRRAVDRLLDHVDQLLAASVPLPAQISDRGLSAQVRAIHTLAGRLSARLRRKDVLARKVALSAVDWCAAFLAGAGRWILRT